MLNLFCHESLATIRYIFSVKRQGLLSTVIHCSRMFALYYLQNMLLKTILNIHMVKVFYVHLLSRASNLGWHDGAALLCCMKMQISKILRFSLVLRDK